MADEKKSSEYEVVKQGQEEVLKINAVKWPYNPSVEDNQLVMQTAINKLIENPAVSRITFSQRRNYEYNYEQTQFLKEIANVFSFLIKQKNLQKLANLSLNVDRKGFFLNKYRNVQNIILNLLRRDPLGAYVEIKRRLREEKIALENDILSEDKTVRKLYIDFLNQLHTILGNTRLINSVRSDLEGLKVGDRSLYRTIFKPSITPNFMFTRLMASMPLNSKIVDVYSVGENDISMLRIPGRVKYMYHISPPEFRIREQEYELLDLAMGLLTQHQPKAQEFVDPTRMRRTFFNIGQDLIQELSEQKRFDLDFEEIKNLANILVRYTVGFGLLESLLYDNKIQDITVNGPIGQTPIFIVHQDYGECVTNIYPAREDGESWATKLRLLSGRPLDEANPILDTELVLPTVRARVAAMTSPLNPLGLAYALRRHRDNPWTYPLFIKNKMFNALAAGLMSFLVDGARTMLIAGTRSSGKTSFLDSTMLEIMRKYRVITVEDTLELSVSRLRELGYNIQPMKVRAALTSASNEVTAEEGIRTSLRLGDSCLIVGEVRSVEAKALFESMRIGALANLVAGTIHGASPYGVFDRVVNDLGVPRTSFKATDVIVVANPISSPGGLKKYKRVITISEIRKHWEDDPLREQGFVDLMRYDVKKDTLVPTEELMNGDSEVIKSVAANVRGWAGNWDAIWDNILLRANVKKALVELADKSNNPRLLEGKFVVASNDQFHLISNKVQEEVGYLDSKLIFKRWRSWLLKEAKKK